MSFQWLERGLLKITSETQIIAAQDQALAVRAIQSVEFMAYLCLHRVEYVIPHLRFIE